MVDYPYEETFDADYNYEAGYLAGLRAALRLLLGGGHLQELSACIQEQVPICKQAHDAQEDD